jgi:hypothetical protein
MTHHKDTTSLDRVTSLNDMELSKGLSRNHLEWIGSYSIAAPLDEGKQERQSIVGLGCLEKVVEHKYQSA